MVGKVNLYLPGDAELAQKAGDAYEIISDKVEVEASIRYATEKEAVITASRAASAGETAVIVATRDNFCMVKLLLLKVLSVKVLRSSTVIRNLGIRISRNSKEYKIQTAVPEGGKIFPTETGIDSAISCSLGKGHVVLLPIGADELKFALEEGALDIEEPEKSAKEILVEKLEPVEKAGKTIGIANFGFSPALAKVIENAGISKGIYKKADVDVEGDISDKEYIANVAKAAKEKYGCDYGVAISGIAEDGTVSVAVADDEAAKVEIVHSIEDDTEENLAKAAVIKLIEMIAEVAGEGINPPERPGLKNDTTPLMFVTSIVVLVAVICMAIGIFVYKKLTVEAPTEAATEATVTVVSLTSEEEETGDENGEVIGFEGTTYENGAFPSYAANGQYTTAGMKIVTSLAEAASGLSSSIAQGLNNLVNREESVTLPTGQGEFTFTVYGYGHGVGMSQRGAIALANEGKTYQQILTYYYQGVTIGTDMNTPKMITKGGVEMTLVAFLCKTVAREIGYNSPVEAMKAQAVAAYTFAMVNSFDGQQSFNAGFDYKGTTLEKCVFEILHINSEDEQPHADYMYDKNGNYVNAVYFASAARKTTSSASVWGAKKSYLVGGKYSPEEVEVSTRSFTTEEMKTRIQNYAASTGQTADFSGDPSTWLRIISHDGSYSSAIGYVDTINVCGMNMSGNTFREKVMGGNLKSHCFVISYVRYKYK